MSDIPDDVFVTWVQTYRLLDSATLGQCRASQLYYRSRGQVVSLFAVARQHQLLPPSTLDRMLAEAARQAQRPTSPPGPAAQVATPTPPTVSTPPAASTPPAVSTPPVTSTPPAKLRPSAPRRRPKRTAGVSSARLPQSAPRSKAPWVAAGVLTVGLLGAVAIVSQTPGSASPPQEVAQRSPTPTPPATSAPAGSGPEGGAPSPEPRPAEAAPSPEPRPVKAAPSPVPPASVAPSPEPLARPTTPAATQPPSATPEPTNPPEWPAGLPPQRALAVKDLQQRLMDDGKRAEAERLTHQYIADTERIVKTLAPDDPLHGILWADLVIYYAQLGRSEECERAVIRTLKQISRLQQPAVAVAASEVGHFFLQKAPDTGLDFCTKLLRYGADALPVEPKVSLLAKLATIEARSRLLPEARQRLKQARDALAGVSPSESPKGWYHLLLAEAEFFHTAQLREQSVTACERALELLPRVYPPDEIAHYEGLHAIATFTNGANLLRLSSELCERAMAGLERLPDGRPRRVVQFRVLTVQASNAHVLGRPDEAQALYDRALEIAESSQINPGLSYDNMASLANERKDYDRAIELYELYLETIAIRDVPNGNWIRVERNLCNAMYLAGRVGEALGRTDRINRVFLDYLDRKALALTTAERLQSTTEQQDAMSEWLTLTTHVDPPRAGYEGGVRIHGYLERASSALRRTLRRDPDSRAKLLALREADEALSRQLYATPSPGDEASHEQALAAARTRRDELEVALNTGSSTWAQSRGRLRASLTDVRRQLGADQVLVAYLRCYSEYVAFVVPPTGPVARVELGAVDPIESAAEAFYARVKQPARSEAEAVALGRAAEALHAKIWKPLQAQVGDAELVYVVPDGPLATVAFSALPGRLEGSVLLEDHTIAALAHAQDLLPWAEAPQRGKGMLALGGVDYDRASTETPEGMLEVPRARRISLTERKQKALAGMQFTPLVGTMAEARTVMGLYSQATRQPGYLLEGPLATEQHLRRYAPGRHVLHLATHGFVRLDLVDQDPGAPLDPLLTSGLALAGCNLAAGGGQDDGILTALEAAELDLDGVDLVVLSACETARGSAEAGEAVIGLTSAFREAGAQTVLSSLWPVNDQATAMLMELVYRYALAEKIPPALALRKAALFMRAYEVEHEGRRIRPLESPALWAPFVAWGPVE